MTKNMLQVFLVSTAAMTVLCAWNTAEGQESNSTETFFDGYEKNFTVSNLTIGELPPPPEGGKYISGFQDNATESQNVTASQSSTADSTNEAKEEAEQPSSPHPEDAQEDLKVFRSE
jgi:hypothetical protein